MIFFILFLQVRVLQVCVLPVRVLLIRVLLVRLLLVRVLIVHVLLIHVLLVRVLLVQSIPVQSTKRSMPRKKSESGKIRFLTRGMEHDTSGFARIRKEYGSVSWDFRATTRLFSQSS